MNFRKNLLLAMVISGLVLGATATMSVMAGSGPAYSGYPLVKLNLSGTVNYTTNAQPTKSIPIKTKTFNNGSLIKMLNDSTNALKYVFLVTGHTNIPSGSYFIWDPFSGVLYLTNKTGFVFPLEGAGYSLGYLEVHNGTLIGTYRYSSLSTKAGSEKDYAGVYFNFNDAADPINEIAIDGLATLNWSYGAASYGTQKATLKVAVSGNGNGRVTDASRIDGYDAIPVTFTANGSGSIANMPTSYEPFFYRAGAVGSTATPASNASPALNVPPAGH